MNYHPELVSTVGTDRRRAFTNAADEHRLVGATGQRRQGFFASLISTLRRHDRPAVAQAVEWRGERRQPVWCEQPVGRREAA